MVQLGYLLHRWDSSRINRYQHHQVGSVPASGVVESFVHQVSCNAFIFLGNFHMDDLDESVLRLGERGCSVGSIAGRGAWGGGGLGATPNILPLKAQGNGRAIRVQVM